jgi:hypothetical protein
VLHPGGSTGAAHDLGFERLRPNARYRVEGAGSSEILADAAGRARLQVTLSGRTEVWLRLVDEAGRKGRGKRISSGD